MSRHFVIPASRYRKPVTSPKSLGSERALFAVFEFAYLDLA